MEELDQQKLAGKETSSEDQINTPIDCVLPLCEKINKKNIKKDSRQEKTNNANQIEKPFEGTTINKNDELDDLL